ncbi:MAG TPA: energy-coupling factor ABC transporter permease [Propionicimonas sp.]|nr:energy-coupling factor ABC transporter permease [Propionicimonas sp.]
MHVPDGFLNLPTSAATAVVAAAGVGLAVRGARRELDERTAPLAGLTAAFIFAAQMLNFPVAAGTSGHLLGGALAAILVGPWTATLCVTVVLIVQAFLFADGGITALGTNITLMALVGVWVGWAVFRLAMKVLPKKLATVPIAGAVGGFVSVPVAALTFAGLFAFGGTVPIPAGTVALAMGGIHILIGIGEAFITAAVLAAVLAVRPDLVYGARGIAKPVDLTIKEGVPA